MKFKMIILICFLYQVQAMASFKELNKMSSPFHLAPLPFAAKSLEPFIDQVTMEIHHGKHHQSYVDNLNKALGENRNSILDIFKDVSKRSDDVRNNAGGHWNHTFFWSVLSAEKGDQQVPKKLNKDIEKTFGSMKKFREEFEKKGAEQFGSGWVWLIRKEGKLKITSTPNQDNPLMDDAAERGWPILGADVWEHAYYLKYKNERKRYLQNFWNVVNWRKVNEYYEETAKNKLP
jgi:superoxide dismutase, Fe-Mn family